MNKEDLDKTVGEAIGDDGDSLERAVLVIESAFSRYLQGGGQDIELMRTMHHMAALKRGSSMGEDKRIGAMVQEDVVSLVKMHTAVANKTMVYDEAHAFSLVVTNALIAVFRIIKAGNTGGWGYVRKVCSDTIDWMKSSHQ